MNVNQTLLRLVKDVNEIKAALRQVTTNLPLYDIANENSPAAISTDQNNYVPGNYDILRINATANITITGFAGGVKGRFLRVFNVGTGEITIAHQNTGSLPQNRVVTPTGFGSVISPNEEFLLYYDSTQQRWITSYSSNADRISARLVLPADQSIANATYSSLSWSVNLDTGNFFDAGSPTLITIPQTGWYFIKTTVIWDANGTNLRETFIAEQTSAVPRVWDSRLAVNAAQTVVSLSDISYYSVGHNFRVGVWQNSGGDLNVLKERAPTSTLVSVFSVVKI